MVQCSTERHVVEREGRRKTLRPFPQQNCFKHGQQKLTNFAEKAPAFRHGDESARQTWHFGKTLLQNDEVSGIIVASLDSPKESGCAGDEKETA